METVRNNYRYLIAAVLLMGGTFIGPSVAKAEAEWREDALLGWVADVGVWDYSPRMGFVYTELSPWVYSTQLGWMYGVGGGDLLYWWMPYLDWVLDFKGSYPQFYHVASDDYIFVGNNSTAQLPRITDRMARMWSFRNGEAIVAEDGSTQPALRLVVEPVFPEYLRYGNLEWIVVVTFIIDEFGRVEKESIEVERADHQSLKDAVLEVVPLWRFDSAKDEQGLPIRFKARQPFFFKVRPS